MKVYIQSNERQLSAAKVSKNTFEREKERHGCGAQKKWS